MAWDLWGPPPSYPVDEGSSFGVQPDWQSGYYFDATEEDALNDKCCVQVLRILIDKADSDIDELEQDLVLLQSELAWIEDNEWSKRCSMVLKDMINCLNVSISSLREEDNNGVEVHLLMPTQPVERLHVIFKALLESRLHEQVAQEPSEDVKDTIVKSLHLDVSGQATKGLENGTKRKNCHLDTIMHDEMKDSCAAKGDGSNFNAGSRLQETKISNPKRIKPTDPIVRKENELDLRSAKGLDENHQCYSRLNTSEQSSNADMGQKLCDIVSTPARDRVMKKFKIASSSNKMNKLQHTVQAREANLDKKKNDTLTSPFEAQDRRLTSRVQMGSSDCNTVDLMHALPLNESCSGNSEAETLESVPSGLTKLESLKLADLRKIAKERKIVGYSKLRKKALLELLADWVLNHHVSSSLYRKS